MRRILLFLLLFFLFPTLVDANESLFHFSNNYVVTKHFSFRLENPELLKGDIRFFESNGSSTVTLASPDNSTILNIVCFTEENTEQKLQPYLLPVNWQELPQNSQLFEEWLSKMQDEIFNSTDKKAKFKIIPQQKANTGKIKIAKNDKIKQFNIPEKSSGLLCGFLYKVQEKDLSFAGSVIIYEGNIYTITYLSTNGFQLFTNVIETLKLIDNK